MDITRGEQPGSHRGQRLVIKIARKHISDLDCTRGSHDFGSHAGRDILNNLKYPLQSGTVPMWVVPLITIVLPIIIFLSFYYRTRDAYDLHHAILGLLFSIFLTAVITEIIKHAVGRLRPHFFWRCFPDGKEDGELTNIAGH